MEAVLVKNVADNISTALDLFFLAAPLGTFGRFGLAQAVSQ